MPGFGSGSNPNGQFWYGNSTKFPGFLYKRNNNVGGRRSTLFNPGGNIFCNKSRYLYNKFRPGTGGVGASNISNRRAKNIHASSCMDVKNAFCGEFHKYLGRYMNYTQNPNGFFPFPPSPFPGATVQRFVSSATNYPN